MRSALLHSLVAVALLFSHSHVYAQVPVVDLRAIVQDAQEFSQQIGQLEKQYTEMVGIYTNLLRQLDPNSIAQQLMGAANPMPQVGQVTSMITGSGNFGSLTGLANQFLNSDTYYKPQSAGNNDFIAGLLNRNVNTLAGLQSMAQQSLTSLQTHMAVIQQIQQELSAATTQADVAGLQGRLQAEQANLQAQQVQAQSIAALAQAQNLAYDSMREQKQRQDADELLNKAGGNAAGGAVMVPRRATPNAIPATFSAGG
jgi:type IV secretion system protein VirB5